MGNKVIYIADIDQDIDDIIAIDYLNMQEVLKGVVLDPEPKSELGLKRLDEIKAKGVKIFKEVTQCDYIFNGGAFTKLAKYLRTNDTKVIVANGGFVGYNISKNTLMKFWDKKYVRTFNFNIDVNATVEVLNSKNYAELYLIGKNVCHSAKNTIQGIWGNFDFLKQYRLRKGKRLHDLLMVQEGIKIINNNINSSSLLEFDKITCVNRGLKGKNTEWGSELGGKINAAIGWRD